MIKRTSSCDTKRTVPAPTQLLKVPSDGGVAAETETYC